MCVAALVTEVHTEVSFPDYLGHVFNDANAESITQSRDLCLSSSYLCPTECLHKIKNKLV